VVLAGFAGIGIGSIITLALTNGSRSNQIAAQQTPSTNTAVPTTAPPQAGVVVPPKGSEPPPAGTAQLPPAVELPPNPYGYVVVKTKSGKTRCMIKPDWIACETSGTQWPPHPDGTPHHSVEITSSGDIHFGDGQIGNPPETTIGYQTCRAMGWTIVATFDGTTLTNDRTGHGAFVSIQDVHPV
jgi:hypothetical protein